MAMIDDINEFIAYMENTYGTKVKVARFVDAPITKDTQVVDIWATAVSEYFGCEKDKLFKKSRQGNSIEKMWLQYFLMDREMLTSLSIYKMFGYKNHTVLYSNKHVCKGFSEVYPEIHDGIVAIYERKIKELGLNKKIKIV